MDRELNIKVEPGGTKPPMPSWPTLTPLDVGVLAASHSERDGGPQGFGIVVVVDSEQLPALSEALDKAMKGHEFDYRASWAVDTEMSPDSSAATAFLLVELVDVGLQFQVAIDLDENHKGLAYAAHSERVIITDRELGGALRSGQPLEAMLASGRLISVGIPDTNPLKSALIQRFDPPPASEGDATGEDDDPEPTPEEFRRGAVPSRVTGVDATPGTIPIIVIVDADIDLLRGRIDEDNPPRGDWRGLRTELGALARFDCFDGEEALRSWVIPKPPEAMVRIALAGFHGVIVVADPLPEHDSEATYEAIQAGVKIMGAQSYEAMLKILDQADPTQPQTPSA